MLSLLLHVLDLYPLHNFFLLRLLAGIQFVSSSDDDVNSGNSDDVFSDTVGSLERLDVVSVVLSQISHPHSHLSGPQ